MKKILSGLLGVILTFTTIATVPVMAESSEENAEVYEAMEVLRLFEIIPDYYDYNTALNEAVTRGDFVDKVVKLMNMSDYADARTYYYDVPATHFAYKGVSVLTDFNIINGVGDKLFRPDEPITTAAACKIVLSVMGYEKLAESKGGYPNGYIAVAHDIDITESLSSGNLTRGEMYMLLYNAMITPMIDENKSSSGTTKFEASEDETILSVYHDIYLREGVVTGAEFVSLNGVGLRNFDEILIDDEVFESDVEAYQYLGEEVEYFAYINEKTDEQRVLWMKPTGKTETLLIEKEKIADFDKQGFVLNYYSETDKAKKVNLDRGIKVIYNGKEILEDTDEIFASEDYSVKFVGQNENFDTAIVKKAETFVVERVNENEMTAFNKLLPQEFLRLDESLYDTLIIKEDGKATNAQSIKSDSVLTLFLSQDGKMLEVIISDDVITGELTSASEDEDGREIVVNANEYKIEKGYQKAIPGVGNNVTLYLNSFGEVSHIEATDGSDMTAAYIIKMHNDEDNDTVKIKAFTQKGEFITFDCAKKVEVDGEWFKEPKAVMSQISRYGEKENQLVLIKTDNNGLISSVDTSYFREGVEDENNSLIQNITLQNLAYKSQGYLQTKGVINSGTIIFEIPENVQGASDFDFAIRTKSDFKNDSSYKVESYNMSKRQAYESFVVNRVSAKSATGNTNLPIVVQGIVTVLNADGEAVEGIKGRQGNSNVTLPTDGDISLEEKGIKTGMIVRIARNNAGEVSDAQIIFDPETTPNSTITQFSARYGIEIGYVNDVLGDVIKVSFESPEKVGHVITGNGAPVVIYDSENPKELIRGGSFSEAKTYYNCGENCSKILMITNYGVPRLFVIYI